MKESAYLISETDLVDRFRPLPLFKNLATEQLASLINISRIRVYRPGETLIRQGDTDRWFYILVNGCVSVQVDGKLIDNIDRMGEVFGEMAVLKTGPRGATVTASTDVVVIAINSERMESIPDYQKMETDLVIYRFVCAVLSERLRRANGRQARMREWVHSGEAAATTATV
jgi:CRP-like cAMP-binding protein